MPDSTRSTTFHLNSRLRWLAGLIALGLLGVAAQRRSSSTWGRTRCREAVPHTSACRRHDGLTEIRELTPGDLAAAFAVGGVAHPAEGMEMFARHPELFLGALEAGRLAGVCYGWPVRHERAGTMMMRLELIAVIPESRGQGLGRKLLAAWEHRVAQGGAWAIDVGSAADGFFLRCGYTPVEYCLKGADASSGADEPAVHYVPIAGDYSPETKARLQRAVGARQAITIFRKRTG